MGSYDVVFPRIRKLLAKHTRRPVGARVTLTAQNLDVLDIYRHLAEEIGFWEVGFAPVTTSWQRKYAIDERGSWRLVLGGGQEVRLGRRDLDERFYRFFDVVAPTLAAELKRIEYVDLRYTNGFAVGWRDGPPENLAAVAAVPDRG